MDPCRAALARVGWVEVSCKQRSRLFGLTALPSDSATRSWVPASAFGDWVAEHPLWGPRRIWDDWWQRRPHGLGFADTVVLLQSVLPDPEACRFRISDPPALFWLIPALLAQPGAEEWLVGRPFTWRWTSLSNGCIKASVCNSVLDALANRFRNWCWAEHAVDADQEEDRRGLFRTVLAAVSWESATACLSATAARARSAGKGLVVRTDDLGGVLLGVAYRLHCWEEADRLEALGQTPDGVLGKRLCVPMALGSVAAWDRALAKGWDPGAPVELEQDTQLRWRWWVGRRKTDHNETNDPLVAHAVTWARTHDPDGVRSWYREACWSAAVTANTPQKVEAAWALMGSWLPEVLNTTDSRRSAPGELMLWQWLAVCAPHLWYDRLAGQERAGLLMPPAAGFSERSWSPTGPHRSALHEALLMGEEWPSEEASLLRVPVTEREGVLQIIERLSRPAAVGLLSLPWHLPTLTHPEVGWLVTRLPASWWWGTDPEEAVQELRNRLDHTAEDHASLRDVRTRDEVARLAVRVAGVHPPPPEWRAAVALLAAERGDADTVRALVKQGLTAEDVESQRRLGSWSDLWDAAEPVLAAVNAAAALSAGLPAREASVRVRL